MSTKKQIEANRRNAKKSTGPRTEAGKAVASRNALTHGLSSRQVVLPDEDAGAFEQLRAQLLADLWPESELEKMFVHRLAVVHWRLARVTTIETELLERLRRDALGRDEGLAAAWLRDAGAGGGPLARLMRYEAALERNATRLLAELRRLQGERRRDERVAGTDLQARADARHASRGGDWWLRPEAAWPGAPADASAAPADAAANPAAAPAAKSNGANGQGTNGQGTNGHGPNGHGPNGHGDNSANGHGANGHGPDGRRRLVRTPRPRTLN